MPKLILVEDDIVMIGLLRTLFELEGLQVVPFHGNSTEELTALLHLEKPDIMLLDVNLPHMNGLEVMVTLRQDPELKGLHVVMTSGMDLKVECLKSGASAFILKPFNPDELLKLVTEQILN